MVVVIVVVVVFVIIIIIISCNGNAKLLPNLPKVEVMLTASAAPHFFIQEETVEDITRLLHLLVCEKANLEQNF